MSDDFVTSILGDTTPLVTSPPRHNKGERSRGKSMKAQKDGQRRPAGPVPEATPNVSYQTMATVPIDESVSSTTPVRQGNGIQRGYTTPTKETFEQTFLREKAEELASSEYGAFDSPRAKGNASEDDGDAASVSINAENDMLGGRSKALFRYALLFINFTFVVGAILMVMAGVVARYNSALSLCSACGDLTLASIILGAIQWLLALFAFNWIRERNILFLLAYVAAVLVITVALIAIFIAGCVYSAELSDKTKTSQFLSQWESDLEAKASSGFSPLCDVQRTYNCSGFYYGCCDPTAPCFPVTTEGNVTFHRPDLAAKVCPICPLAIPSPRICTQEVLRSAQQNLGGFLVITMFSALLAVTGMSLAAFARHMNR